MDINRSKIHNYKLSPAKYIVIIYFIILFIITMFLSLPGIVNNGANVSLMDIVFTSFSALTVTGLTTINLADTFSTSGLIIITIAMQIGGIGIMAVWSFVWIYLGKNLGIGYRQLIQIEQNQNKMLSLKKLMKLVFKIALIIEFFAFIIFILLLYFRGYYLTLKESAYYAGFHVVSSYTNSGFSIFENNLYNFTNDYVFQTFTMILIILGAIGFPIIIETYSFILAKINKDNFKFSLFFKITILSFVSVFLFGILALLISEHNGIMQGMSLIEKIMYATFYSVTSRSAGLSLHDISGMYDLSLLLMSVLMFIGANPSSVGGGIRTTTLATCVLAIKSFVLNQKNIKAFGRKLDDEDIHKSFIIVLSASIIVFLAIISISVLEDYNFTLIDIAVEVTSAFGTCGLSTGITASLSNASKIILLFLMFIGRIGILAFLMSLRRLDKEEADINYPVEKIMVG